MIPIRKLKHGLLALACALAVTAQAAAEPTPPRDGRHDFDFEFGTWKTHLTRRLKPLTGSNTWVAYDGVSTLQPIWKGDGNVGELDVSGPAGRIQGLTIRLYNPASRQWNITFANHAQGTLGLPMVGGFENGRGEFYDQEMLGDRAIFVRFIFSDITARTFKLEQAFSGDGGKTWEANWIASFEKVSDKVGG